MNGPAPRSVSASPASLTSRVSVDSCGVRAAVSVIGVFYYLRVVKLMYFDAPNASAPPTESHPGVRLALGLNALAVLVLGLFPESLLSLCEQVLG